MNARPFWLMHSRQSAAADCLSVDVKSPWIHAYWAMN